MPREVYPKFGFFGPEGLKARERSERCANSLRSFSEAARQAAARGAAPRRRRRRGNAVSLAPSARWAARPADVRPLPALKAAARSSGRFPRAAPPRAQAVKPAAIDRAKSGD